MVDISITIPKELKYGWLREIEEAAEEEMDLFYKIPGIPQKPIIGSKCFVIIKGQMIGYHIIKAVRFEAESWECQITGNVWTPGYYIVREAKTWVKFKKPIPMKGHRGFRYIESKEVQTYNGEEFVVVKADDWHNR